MERCTHEHREARKRHGVSGVKVQAQCASCGRGVGASIPLRHFPMSVWPHLSPWEPHARPTKRRRALLAYYRSPRWRALRQKRLERDGYVCGVKSERCTVEATEVHHLRYPEILGRESVEQDLISVCSPCHRALDGKGA